MVSYQNKEHFVRLRRALSLILKSGKKLKKAYYRDSIAQFTKSAGEPCTEYDLAIDRHLREKLLGKFPQDSWLSEESVPQTGTSLFQWVLDPIDGTSNFANHIPFFCISLCLMEGSEAVAGIIHDPVQKQTYIAFEGKSYHLSKKNRWLPVQIPEKKIAQGILSMSNHCSAHPQKESLYSAWLSLENKAQSSRRLGCTALEIVFVGLGKLSLFLVLGYRIWDIAAAFLFAKNAGALFFHDETHRHLVIYNPALKKEVQAVVAEI